MGNNPLAVFIKAEKQLNQALETFKTPGQGESLVKIQQLSYFLEKYNADLFRKIITEQMTSLYTFRSKFKQVTQITNVTPQESGIQFEYRGKIYLAPWVNLTSLKEQFKLDIKWCIFRGF